MSGTKNQPDAPHEPAPPALSSTSLAAALQKQEWDARTRNEFDPTLYSFLDSLPGMACQIRLDDRLHLSYVSEGCHDLLGISATELQDHPERLIGCLHPDDASSFYDSMRTSMQHRSPWNWEGRIVLPHNSEIKWVSLRATLHEAHADSTSWKAFIVNITQNKQAEIELKESRLRLCELSSHIESIKEEERTRIAREIHDEIGALLTALKMDLAWVTRRLPSENSALLEKTQDMADLLDTAGKAANELVHSLRPGSLDCFGIVAAIEIETAEFAKRTNIICKVSKSEDEIDVAEEQSITLYRVLQEALNNIMKHAAAHRVEISISRPDASQIELIVSDDGCGFDEAARDKPRSFGLRGMQERITQLGGTARIISTPGSGTRITVRLPLH